MAIKVQIPSHLIFWEHEMPDSMSYPRPKWYFTVEGTEFYGRLGRDAWSKIKKEVIDEFPSKPSINLLFDTEEEAVTFKLTYL